MYSPAIYSTFSLYFEPNSEGVSEGGGELGHVSLSEPRKLCKRCDLTKIPAAMLYNLTSESSRGYSAFYRLTHQLKAAKLLSSAAPVAAVFWLFVDYGNWTLELSGAARKARRWDLESFHEIKWKPNWIKLECLPALVAASLPFPQFEFFFHFNDCAPWQHF